jgi:hypothetical protein
MSEAELAQYFLTKKIPYVKPLYAIDLKKDREILEWFDQAENNLKQYYQPLFREQRQNLSVLIGGGVNPNFATPFAATFATTSDLYANPQEVFINEMYRVVLDQVSLIVSHDLVPDVLPNTEEYSDRVACTVVKDWLDSIHYDLNTESWRFKWEVQKKVFGESFCVPLWNPFKGDLHPEAREALGEEAELIGDDDEPIQDFKGAPIKLKKNIRIGDIEYANPLPWDVMIDPQQMYEDSNWFYWKEYIEVDYLKKKYPKINWETNKITEVQYDPYTNSERDNPNKRVIWYLFHKSHQFMEDGRFIVCSKTDVLVNEPLNLPTLINNQELPLVRFRDLDIGFGVRGIPILFRNVRNIHDGYNRITNQIMNNLEMESPKLFVHQSSGVDAQRMPNGVVCVEWMGNIKPTIETPTTNTSSIFNFREALKKNIDEMALQTPMVRGDTPNAQLDSFIALQHFEDQRQQLASPDVKGHLRSMEHLFRLEITIARDRYKKDDGRLIKILGKHNVTQLKYFDPINLQKSYDVKITTTGTLANSKAARTQMMMTLKEKMPHLINDEMFLDYLGLSHSKKFMTAITAAVSSGEAENYDMMNGESVLPPTRFEDLIVHWETHRIPMQTLDFKQSPPEVQELFFRHVAATEKLMFEQGAENPMFIQRLEELKQFPMFYTPKPVNELPPDAIIPQGPLPDMPPAGPEQAAI